MKTPFAAALLAALALTSQAAPPAVPTSNPPPPVAFEAPPVPSTFTTTKNPVPLADPTAPIPTTQGPAFPDYADHPQIHLDVLMVSVPEAKALALLPQLRDPGQIETAQASLLALVAAQQGKLIDWPEVTAHSGVRAVAENIDEYRYAYSWLSLQTPPTASQPPKELSPEAKALLASGLVPPDDMETRDLGTTLEAVCVAAPDGSGINLSIDIRRVELLGLLDIPAGRNPKGEPFTLQQPYFQAQKINANLTLRPGERHLLYVGKPRQPAGTLTLFIAGATILPPRSKN